MNVLFVNISPIPHKANSCYIKDEDYYGVYMLGKPVLCINSVDMIRDITVKYFNNFVNRWAIL